MAFLTRRGALSVTTDLDRLANLFQHNASDLGVPSEYAHKFAYYCDVLSDRIETHAKRLAEDTTTSEDEEETAPTDKTAEDTSEDDSDKDSSKKASTRRKAEAEVEEESDKDSSKKKASKKNRKADDETGLSVDHGAAGFDANVIGDEVPGPLVETPPVESWMAPFFKQIQFQELGDLQGAGALEAAAARGQIITKAAKQSLARLRRLASTSRLSEIEDLLKVIHAKLVASTVAEVKSIAPDLQKQVDAVGKVRDALLEQQASGLVTPECLDASDRIVQAVSEQIPFLQQVVSGVDSGSPVALLEFQKLLGGGSVKDLIAVGADIVVSAAKSCSPKVEKEASEESDETAEDEDDSSKTASEDEEVDEEEDEDSVDESKTASTFGYDLFTK